MHDFSKMSGYLDSLVQNGLPGPVTLKSLKTK